MSILDDIIAASQKPADPVVQAKILRRTKILIGFIVVCAVVGVYLGW